MGFKLKEIAGQRFGRLVAISRTEKKYHGCYVWKYQCDCGNIVDKPIQNVGKNTHSCGCLLSEYRNTPRYRKSREYESPIHKYRVDNYLTVCELAKKCETSQGKISGLANGMESPIYESFWRGKNPGDLKPYVEKLLVIFRVKFSDLFPRYECRLPGYKPDLTSDQLFEITTSNATRGCTLKESRALWALIEKVFNKSSNTRAEKAIFMYYKEGATLESIGQIFNITRERVRQIINKGIRILRHPANIGHFEIYKETFYT